ncbi:MAG TPA: hypothetical protein VK892_09945 [Pyrinomonadaceae bacterium]|nr:hypothetical protein [Pyrinomonadaceae bacterium]
MQTLSKLLQKSHIILEHQAYVVERWNLFIFLPNKVISVKKN